MSNTEYVTDLAQLDDAYVDCEPAERKAFEDVPPGRYQALIDRLYLDRAKSSKRLLLKWELLIATGPQKGRRLFRNNTVETPDNLRWLKADLQTAGLTITRLSELPEHLDAQALIGVLLDITVASKGSGDQARTNIYLNKRIDREDGAPAPAATPPAKGGSRGLSRF
ncbi:MAG TPA: DUF669 domain-containing protein [Armatimonadota bacterium]|jgi:hypothetical protein